MWHIYEKLAALSNKIQERASVYVATDNGFHSCNNHRFSKMNLPGSSQGTQIILGPKGDDGH